MAPTQPGVKGPAELDSNVGNCSRGLAPSAYDGRVLDRESVTRLAELVQERRPCVVLTGAGVSTV
jgi:hypothetical protein